TACAGQPDPVTITGPSSVCPGVPFALQATGASSGTGITYQWEEFTDGGITWTSVGGSSTMLNMASGITVPTEYRFTTTCTNGGGQDISMEHAVGINLPNACYCTPTYTNGCSSGYDIRDVILMGDLPP